ncbi:MAG: hypothetical protein ACRED5_15480 [Propylenella sp.]
MSTSQPRRRSSGGSARKDRDAKAGDMQPGTAEPGKSWQSRTPDPEDKDDQLNQALKDSFPASDPPQPAQPGVTGWDLMDEDKKKKRHKRSVA